MTKRFFATMRTDVTIQWVNKLYYIGPAVAIIIAVILSQTVNVAELGQSIPSVMLMVVGGSTMLYVAAMILFEKEEGTINALMVSPLTVREYLLSKIITLTGLATLESVIMVAGTVLLLGISAAWTFNYGVLLLGIVTIGVVYTLIGIIMIVRYQSITDFLMPVFFLTLVLTAPFVHFVGWLESYIFYIIPTSAPTLMMSAAWHPLALWQWWYALCYSALIIVALTIWAFRAFHTHIVMKVG